MYFEEIIRPQQLYHKAIMKGPKKFLI